MWKAVGKALLAGVIAALAGLVSAEFISAYLLTGLNRDIARLLGMGAYLCFLLAGCAALILGKMGKK